MNRIKRIVGRFRGDHRGLLTFEWILLISLLVIGVIGGLGAVRNALICELVELAHCIESIDFCEEDGEPCVCDITDPNCCMNGGNPVPIFSQGGNSQGGSSNNSGHPHHSHKPGHGHAPGTPAPSKEHP